MERARRPAVPVRAEVPVGRRTLLRAGAAALAGLSGGAVLAGCGIHVRDIRWDPSLGEDRAGPTPRPGPDELARRRAVASSQRLLVACLTAATTWPQAAPVLRSVAEQHREHLRALGGSVPATPATPSGGTTASTRPVAPSQTPSTATGAAASTGAAAQPVTPDELVTGHVSAATQALADTATTSGPLARLLAQVGAARAVQARQVAAALAVAAPAEPEVPQPVQTTAALPQPSHTTAAPPTSTPSASASATPDLVLRRTTVRSLQAAVEGEDAAVYGYEVLAVRLPDGGREQAEAAIRAHQDAAEGLGALLRRAGGQEPPAAPGYRLPGPVQTPEQATALAAHLESALATLDSDLVAASDGQVRALAVRLLVQRALAASAWGAEPTAFPGG